MNHTHHGYDLVAHGLVQSLGEMLGTHSGLAPTRAVPSGLAYLCRQAEKWDRALRVDMPAGNFSGLAELAHDDSASKSMRDRAANMLIWGARQAIGQDRVEEAERLAREAAKISPDPSYVIGILGHSLYMRGHTRQALKWFESITDWRTRRTDHTLSHCMLLIELHECDRARILMNLLSEMESSADPLHRLQFRLLTALLSKSDIPASCAVASAREPLVPTALQPYSNFLMRRTESPAADSFDQRAARILASAMVEEQGIHPYPSHHMVTLARWLILTGQAREALQLIEEEVRRGGTIPEAFAVLCVFLWISGEVDFARDYLTRMDSSSATSDMHWFIRSVACAVAGDTNRATACLSSLFQQAPRFFMTQPLVTVWGMLALVLKALGRDSLARSARSLAAQKDPLDSCRAHLWDRITAPTSQHPFPAFALPADFMESKS